MEDNAIKYGAQIYFYDDVILVKQTKLNESKTRYVIDAGGLVNHNERRVDARDDKALLEAIRLAGQGKLVEKRLKSAR